MTEFAKWGSTNSTMSPRDNNGRRIIISIAKNVWAFVVGLVVGVIVLVGVNVVLSYLFPAPMRRPRDDELTLELLRKMTMQIPLINLVCSIVSHSSGTFVGAFVAARFAVSYQKMIAAAVGFLFFAGSLFGVLFFHFPLWFMILDLLIPYVPMAWLGAYLATRKTSSSGWSET